MSNLEKTEEQIMIKPEDYESYVASVGATESYAVGPISADAISDAAIELGMTPHFYDDGICQIVDHEYSDEVATMTYYGVNIDGEDQWVIEYFESKDTWIEIEEDRFGTVVWKIARKLEVQIVSKFWIDYHFQQFPNCGLDRTNVGNSGGGADETRHLLEVIWDTYYGDFEYEREFKTIEKIYKEVKKVKPKQEEEACHTQELKQNSQSTQEHVLGEGSKSYLEIFKEHVEGFTFGFDGGNPPYVNWMMDEGVPEGPNTEKVRMNCECLSDMWFDRCMTYVEEHMHGRGFLPTFRVVYMLDETGDVKIDIYDWIRNSRMYSNSKSDLKKLTKHMLAQKENMSIEVSEICTSFIHEDFGVYIDQLEGGENMN